MIAALKFDVREEKNNEINENKDEEDENGGRESEAVLLFLLSGSVITAFGYYKGERKKNIYNHPGLS